MIDKVIGSKREWEIVGVTLLVSDIVLRIVANALLKKQRSKSRR